MKQHENGNKNKDQRPKNKGTLQRSIVFKFLIIFLTMLFLVYNLISIQTVSPIYYQIMTNDQGSTINFLEKIRTFPEYQKIFEMNKNIYGKSITDSILEKENQKKTLINNLEQVLVYNPKERDVLYSLYQLYLAEGDKNKATYYLQQAKAVDPNLK